MKEEFDCILSFTTWKKRINDRKLLYVIQKALSQKTKYKYKVILCLSEEEFRGKENDIPSELLELEKLCGGKFEILWTWRNTRALKKLNPAMRKYSELPIITFDDDILLSENAVEIFMNHYIKDKTKIYAIITHPFNDNFKRMYLSVQLKLFPPHSLADIPEDAFVKHFLNLEDDIFNAIRASVNGTKSVKIPMGSVILNTNRRLYDRASDLSNEYRRCNAGKMVTDFFREYPQYKQYCV